MSCKKFKCLIYAYVQSTRAFLALTPKKKRSSRTVPTPGSSFYADFLKAIHNMSFLDEPILFILLHLQVGDRYEIDITDALGFDSYC